MIRIWLNKPTLLIGRAAFFKNPFTDYLGKRKAKKEATQFEESFKHYLIAGENYTLSHYQQKVTKQIADNTGGLKGIMANKDKDLETAKNHATLLKAIFPHEKENPDMINKGKIIQICKVSGIDSGAFSHMMSIFMQERLLAKWACNLVKRGIAHPKTDADMSSMVKKDVKNGWFANNSFTQNDRRPQFLLNTKDRAKYENKKIKEKMIV